jgi:2'-5' RNA ligase
LGSDAQGRRSRVFFALWPDEEVRDALAGLAHAAQAQCGGRATAREKIHLTLFFVGDIEIARLAELQTAAASLRTAAFDLVLDRVGHWRHNHIVWAGASACPPALTALAADLKAALARVDVHGEDRPYAPHVTLVRNAARALASGTFPPCIWRAREFALVESVPVAGGVRYDIRVRWPL